MRSKKLLIVLLSYLLMLPLIAQNRFNIISGPRHFMRLNQAGDDFDEIQINNLGGNYTFYHSFADSQCPWSVVSEDDGTNIYTKLNFGLSSNGSDVFLLTPKVQLSSSEIYNFTQSVFAFANETEYPIGSVTIVLKMLAGNPDDFDVSQLDAAQSLGTKSYFTNLSADIVSSDIVPSNDGDYYFVLSFSGVGYQPGNTTGFSLGFKSNMITQRWATDIATKKEMNLSAFPNPANTNVSFPNFKGSVLIYNAMGKLTMRVNDYQGGVLNVSNLNAGIYFVKGDRYFSKFIKK